MVEEGGTASCPISFSLAYSAKKIVTGKDCFCNSTGMTDLGTVNSINQVPESLASSLESFHT